MNLEKLPPQGQDLQINRKFLKTLNFYTAVDKKLDEMSDHEKETEIISIQLGIAEHRKRDPENSGKAIEAALNELLGEYQGRFTKRQLEAICGLIIATEKDPRRLVNRQAKKMEMVHKKNDLSAEKLDGMPLNDLINNCKDDKQKTDWENIRKLTFPQPQNRVKLVILYGGPGINSLDERMKKLASGFGKMYPGKLDVVNIPYENGKSNQQALEELEKKIADGNHDLIIPVLAGRSSTLARKTASDGNKEGQLPKEGNLSNNDLKGLVDKHKKKKFMFMFDSYSPDSVIKDPLSKLNNVIGIMATVQNNSQRDSRFIDRFSKYLNEGKQLGEAFIRTDAIIHRHKTQDAVAMFRINGQRTEIK